MSRFTTSLFAVIVGSAAAMAACGNEATNASGGSGGTPGHDAGADATDGVAGSSLSCDARKARATGVTLNPLSPSSTGAGIDDSFGDHAWSKPVGDRANRLFVFLAGTGGPPGAYTAVLNLAAASGYHVVGLAYPNANAIVALCKGGVDGGSDGGGADCAKLVRREIITGADVSPLVSVDSANSIESRLAQFLLHAGWDEYLDGTTPRWQDIVVAGHSQGAGHAAFIGMIHSVARVVALAGPVETTTWTSEPSQTPSARFWGFVHVEDPNSMAVQKNWDNLQMPGVPTDINAAAPPFSDSHRLLTSATVASAQAAHLYVGLGAGPNDPAFEQLEQAWCTLLGP